MSDDTEFPPHTISEPGETGEMAEQPHDEMRGYAGSGKLEGKAALITGGDSGIGRAVAVAFAKEGADVAISYLSEHGDAEHTKGLVEAEGRKAVTLPGDLSEEATARKVVDDAAGQLGRLDILVNNIAYQKPSSRSRRSRASSGTRRSRRTSTASSGARTRR
jgi:NAD(P)-dependent dehydrogenase (short-subunit alcohol dehydrogenase family)